MARRKPLDYYLKLQYPFRVRVPQEGGYVVDFPDLPGAMTDSDTLDGLPAMIEEARQLWIEVAYEQGLDIPAPTIWNYDEEYSGRFNLRLPPALHEALAEGAREAGVSLNQYVVSLLSRGDAQARIEERLNRLESLMHGERPAGMMIADEKGVYVTTPRQRTKTSRTARRGRSSKP